MCTVQYVMPLPTAQPDIEAPPAAKVYCIVNATGFVMFSVSEQLIDIMEHGNNESIKDTIFSPTRHALTAVICRFANITFVLPNSRSHRCCCRSQSCPSKGKVHAQTVDSAGPEHAE